MHSRLWMLLTMAILCAVVGGSLPSHRQTWTLTLKFNLKKRLHPKKFRVRLQAADGRKWPGTGTRRSQIVVKLVYMETKLSSFSNITSANKMLCANKNFYLTLSAPAEKRNTHEWEKQNGLVQHNVFFWLNHELPRCCCCFITSCIWQTHQCPRLCALRNYCTAFKKRRNYCIVLLSQSIISFSHVLVAF